MGSISILSPSFTYFQDFNSLSFGLPAPGLPNGWTLSESGTSVRVDGTFGYNDGTGNAGDIYSFGPGSAGTPPYGDRSLGELTSNSFSGKFGVSFRNDTNEFVTQFSLTYIAKTWRNGSATLQNLDRLTFEYSTDATSLDTGSWTALPSLDALQSARALEPDTPYNGNDSFYDVSISGVSNVFVLAPGQTLTLRWRSYDIPGTDSGIGIDNVNFSVRTTKPAKNDLNADLTSDILFQNASGQVANWTLSGGKFSTYNNLGNASGYTVAGTGDFNKDGTADILFQDASGNVADWIIQDGKFYAYNPIGFSGSYKVVGTGDFNGDGTSDAVFQDASGNVAVWTLQNGKFQSYANLGNAGGYKVVATGDLNGDGTTDLVFQDAAGNVADWMIKDGKFSSYNALGNAGGFKVVGTGDVNADGTADIVFQNASGQVADWIIQNGRFSSYNNVGNAGGFSVVGTGDYNGDGTSDILFQNAGGQVVNWTLKNEQFNSYNNVGNASGYKAS
jgi:hypothetical protein